MMTTPTKASAARKNAPDKPRGFVSVGWRGCQLPWRACTRAHAHASVHADVDLCAIERALAGKERLLLAAAGDLILWDSRTIHAGHVGTGHTVLEAGQTEAEVPR